MNAMTQEKRRAWATYGPSMRARALFVLLGSLGLWSAAERARACAACACGDPSLTQMGMGKPFAGRLRLSAALQGRSDTLGTPGGGAIRLLEARLTLAVAYAPLRWLMGSVALPLVARRVRYANLAEDRVVGPGDATMRLRLVAWRDRAFAARHLLGVQLAAGVPTMPSLRRRDGEPLPDEVQPVLGWSVSAGPWYAWFDYPWFGYASMTAQHLLGVPGSAIVLGTLLGQYHLSTQWAVRLGAELRWSNVDPAHGGRAPPAGAWVLFAAPAVSWAPATDWLLTATVRWPLLQQLGPGHREGPMVLLEVVHDV